MKFDLRNNRTMMSHLMLSDRDLCMKIRDTPLWTDGGTLEATLQINGIEVPAQVIEDFMKSLWERSCKEAKLKYDGDSFEDRVEAKARQLLKEHSGKALDKLATLTEQLNEIEETITPHWER
ncbi:MAG: hypothetical protein GY928_23235 [Colwellia sp.]|nr:hypothetical protein [Colwellia sp.]